MTQNLIVKENDNWYSINFFSIHMNYRKCQYRKCQNN